MPALRIASLLSLLAVAACSSLQVSPAWPQGAGPNGNWHASGPQPPRSFSVTTDTNIVWRTPLPETGQGGIAIANGRLFVTTMAPWTGEGLSEEDASKYSHAIEKRKVVGKHIAAHCVDQDSGKILWTRRIEGEVPSIYSYPFSDATSASPLASNTHVWFTNAGGTLACYTHTGDLVWQRQWAATFDGPFNKQFEPFLVDDAVRGAQTLVHMEPFDQESEGGKQRWHYLVGLDAITGNELWRSEDALTQYNAPILVATGEGPCVLHARGGPHDVPERPVGLTLIRATGNNAGSKVWRYEDPRGNHEGALQTMAADERYAYWLLREPRSMLVVLDRNTGEQVREISLVQQVSMTSCPDEFGGIFSETSVKDLDKGVFPARYSMIPANGRLYFQCYATAWGKPVLGAPYCFACIDPDAKNGTAAVRYLEVPTGLRHEQHGEVEGITLVYRTKQSAMAINSRGVEITGDQRSQWDGWDWVFNGTPTCVNNHLYFTLATGLVYVLDADNPAFDADAFVALNDLGPIGQTWSANSVSYAGGRLYHRTAAELICIGACETSAQQPRD